MKKNIFLMLTLATLTAFGQVKLTHSIRESFNDTEWIENEKISYIYDGSNLIEENWAYSDSNGLEWSLSEQATYTYNTNNKVLTETHESKDERFSYGYKNISTYDSSGRTTQLIQQELEDLVWVNDSKIELNYSNGLLTTVDATEWDGTNWIKGDDSALYTFQYINGRLNYMIGEIEWNGSTWESKSRNTLTYDSNGFRITKGFEKWDGTNWVILDYIQEYENDAFGNRIHSKEPFYENGILKISQGITSNFDTTQLLSNMIHPFALSELETLLFGNSYVNKLLSSENSERTSRIIYHYSDDDEVASASNFNLVDVSVYPNPTTDFITVSGNVSVKNIEIFTIVGKKVKTTDKTSFSIKEFANGIYILKVNTTDGKTGISQILKK